MCVCVCRGEEEKKAAKTQTDRRIAVQTNGREWRRQMKRNEQQLKLKLNSNSTK